eukprot:3103770-Rhodomonas_salina.1
MGKFLAEAVALVWSFHRNLNRIVRVAEEAEGRGERIRREEEEREDEDEEKDEDEEDEDEGEEDEESGKRVREAVGLMYELHGALHHQDEQRSFLHALRSAAAAEEVGGEGGLLADLRRFGAHALVRGNEVLDEADRAKFEGLVHGLAAAEEGGGRREGLEERGGGSVQRGQGMMGGGREREEGHEEEVEVVEVDSDAEEEV